MSCGVVAKALERQYQYVFRPEDPVKQVHEAVEPEELGIEGWKSVVARIQWSEEILDPADSSDSDLLEPDRPHQGMLFADDEQDPGLGYEARKSSYISFGVAPPRCGVPAEAFIRDDHGRPSMIDLGDPIMDPPAGRVGVEVEFPRKHDAGG